MFSSCLKPDQSVDKFYANSSSILPHINRGHKKVLNLKVNEETSTGATRYYLDSSPERFATITELVDYFRTLPLATLDGPVCLCNPVLRGAENDDVLLCNGSVNAEGARTGESHA